VRACSFAHNDRLCSCVCAHARSHTTTAFARTFGCHSDSLTSSVILASIDTRRRVAFPSEGQLTTRMDFGPLELLWPVSPDLWRHISRQTPGNIIGGHWVAPAPTSERSPVDDLGLANRRDRISRRLKPYLSPLDFGRPMGALKLHTLLRASSSLDSRHDTSRCRARGTVRSARTAACSDRTSADPDLVVKDGHPYPCETTATVPKAAWPAVRRRSHPVARASAGPFVPCVSPHRLESRTSGAPSRQSFGTLERPFNVVIGSSRSRRGEPTWLLTPTRLPLLSPHGADWIRMGMAQSHTGSPELLQSSQPTDTSSAQWRQDSNMWPFGHASLPWEWAAITFVTVVVSCFPKSAAN